MIQGLIISTGFAVLAQITMGQMTDELRTTILDEHNRLRRTISAVAMYELQYDADLECAARQHIERAANGVFGGHNDERKADYQACATNDNRVAEFNSVGENWYSGSAPGAAHGWVDYEWGVQENDIRCSEREALAANDADSQALLAGQTIRAECEGRTDGHYTQVLWGNTRKVGCYYTPAYGTLCNYAPSGNFIGAQYIAYGTPCSECPAGTTCSDGLCAAPASLPESDNGFPDTGNGSPETEDDGATDMDNETPTDPNENDNESNNNNENLDTGTNAEAWSEATFTISTSLYPTFEDSLAKILNIAPSSITVSDSRTEEGSYVITVNLDSAGQNAMLALTQSQLASMQSAGVQSYANSDENSNDAPINSSMSTSATIAITIGAVLAIFGERC